MVIDDDVCTMTKEGCKYSHSNYTNRDFGQFLNCLQPQLRHHEKEKINENLNTESLFVIFIYIGPDIGLAVRVFANGPGDLGSIPGRVIPKTQKMVLDASLLNTQHYKVQIKGKVVKSRERSNAFPYTLV